MKLSEEQWVHIRNLWERSENEGFGWLTDVVFKKYNIKISRPAIVKKAKKDGWVKKEKVIPLPKSIIEEVTQNVTSNLVEVTVKDKSNLLKILDKNQVVIYDSSYAVLANDFCTLYGENIDSLAFYLGVDVETIHRWREQYLEFNNAILKATIETTVAIVSSLKNLALGNYIEVENIYQVNENGERVLVAVKEKKKAPSLQAIQLWLTNMEPQRIKKNPDYKEDIESAFPTEEVLDTLANEQFKIAAEREEKIVNRKEQLLANMNNKV